MSQSLKSDGALQVGRVLKAYNHVLEQPTRALKKAELDAVDPDIRERVKYHVNDTMRRMRAAAAWCLRHPEPLQTVNDLPPSMRRDVRAMVKIQMEKRGY